MVNYNLPLFKHEPEVWDKKKCEKEAKHTATDGIGTKYPFKGYIGNRYGKVHYNGGCTRNGEWWQGEEFPLPVIAEGFEIITVPTWGCRIVKVGDRTRTPEVIL